MRLALRRMGAVRSDLAIRHYATHFMADTLQDLFGGFGCGGWALDQMRSPQACRVKALAARLSMWPMRL